MTNFITLLSTVALVTALASSALRAAQATTPTTTATATTTPVDQKCQHTGSFFCNIDNYNTVQPFNNTLGHTSLEAAKADLHQYAFLLNACKNKTTLFLCSLYFPVCVTSPEVPAKILLPCRDICEEALTCLPAMERIANMSWPSEWDCNNFQYYAKDKLCVINNQEKSSSSSGSSSSSTSSSSSISSISSSSSTARSENDHQAPSFSNQPPQQPIYENASTCDPGFFDCRSSDPKYPFCIDTKYVCDGKKDCFRNDSSVYEGLDEIDCRERCAKGELLCDYKCIKNEDICNGKLDCSSGFDEQNCHNWNDMTSLLLILICITTFVVTFTMLVIRWRCGMEDEANLDSPHKENNFERSPINDAMIEPTYQEPSALYENNHSPLNIAPLPVTSTDIPPHHLLQLGLARSLDHDNFNCIDTQHHTRSLHHRPHQQLPPDLYDTTYHAPSIEERGEYYSFCPPGDSDVSSVYGGSWIPVSGRHLDSPPAPPSTPVIEGGGTGHVYVNDPH